MLLSLLALSCLSQALLVVAGVKSELMGGILCAHLSSLTLLFIESTWAANYY